MQLMYLGEFSQTPLNRRIEMISFRRHEVIFLMSNMLLECLLCVFIIRIQLIASRIHTHKLCNNIVYLLIHYTMPSAFLLGYLIIVVLLQETM